MAFVQRINDEGPGDPYYQTVGLLTLEDVLEELLQAEIMDENDSKFTHFFIKTKLFNIPNINSVIFVIISWKTRSPNV